MLRRVAATSPEERIDWKISPNLFGISLRNPIWRLRTSLRGQGIDRNRETAKQLAEG